MVESTNIDINAVTLAEVEAWMEGLKEEFQNENVPIPEGVTAEQIAEVEAYVATQDILDAATGLNPSTRPGLDVARLMHNRLEWVVANHPNIANNYTLQQLRLA